MHTRLTIKKKTHKIYVKCMDAAAKQNSVMMDKSTDNWILTIFNDWNIWFLWNFQSILSIKIIVSIETFIITVYTVNWGK